MSDFRNYFSDFGLRCFDLYDGGAPIVAEGERDVTRALCVLAAALTIPHERLRPARDERGTLQDATKYSCHPAGDRFRYPATAATYDAKLAEVFSSAFDAAGWRKGKLRGNWGEK